MESTEHLFQIIADVLNTRNTIDGVTHFLLEDFCSTRETKVQPLGAKQPNMSGERRELFRIRVEWDLVVPLIEINLTLHPLRSDTTSSMVGMTCRSLMIAWLRDRMSTQILISFGFDGLGTTTIDETQGVGPSARSIMFSFSSCLSFSSTCFLTWNGMRRCGCATGLTNSSTCIHLCIHPYH